MKRFLKSGLAFLSVALFGAASAVWSGVSFVSAKLIPEGEWGRLCIKRNIYSTQAKGAWCIQIGSTAFLWCVRREWNPHLEVLTPWYKWRYIRPPRARC